MNTNLLVTQQQRPQPRRVAAPPEAPELQEVREDDVRDARGAQLVQRARGLVPAWGQRARGRSAKAALAGPSERRIIPRRRVARRVHLPSGRRVVR